MTPNSSSSPAQSQPDRVFTRNPSSCKNHIQAEPADDDMPKMIGRVINNCSEATFDVDGR
jgi:hypothetical protein